MRAQTLSKPCRTARTLRPSGYGVFIHQSDQSLCLRTPNLKPPPSREGFGGAYLRYLHQGEAIRSPKLIERLGPLPRDRYRRIGAHVGYAGPITNVEPKPCTDISGKELLEPVTHAIEVTLLTPVFS